MTSEHKLWLDTNRHHLATAKKGTISGVNVPTLERIMRSEFKPDYPLFAHDVFEDVAKFLEALYEYYDQWLIDNPNWQPAVTRYGMQEESISKLEAYRELAEAVLSARGTVRNFDLDGLLRVMLLEFDGAYQLNYDDQDQPVKFVRDIYRMFTERIAASEVKISKKKG